MVYVTWGAINWLPDLGPWAKEVSALLSKGGTLYLAESHPAILCFEWIEGRIAPLLRLADAEAPADRQRLAVHLQWGKRQAFEHAHL